MVLVILQHSYLHVNTRLIPPLLDMFLWRITYLAAVSFVAISGTMFSYFLHAQSNWKTVYRRYAARAAFLILFAGPAINLASYFFRITGDVRHAGYHSFFADLFLSFPITDAIAVSLLVSPFFILIFGSTLRAVTITIMLVATPLIVAFVKPVEPYWLIFKEVVFGVLGGEGSMTWWPLMPWLAIFLTGSFVGQDLARLKQGTLSVSTLVREMNKAGIALAVCGLVLTIGYKPLKMAFQADWGRDLFVAIYPGQTTTLLPGYFAILAWLLAALMLIIDISGRYNRFFWLLSILGRTSLFAFVVQFAVVQSAPAVLGLKGSLGLTGFLLLFATGLTVMWFLSYTYGRLRGWFPKNDYDQCVNAARTRRTPF